MQFEGFSAFRDVTEIDFTDADLFAFVGPTGAGKSSIIDAMVFALYGSVPRYASENLVHPVIATGSLEAKVRLDFISGDRLYTATRVVRRTKTGASTKEARLEHGDEVLADDAKSMTARVVDLLGLDLAQFTKCVVLPQGAFATLLHDSKASRQDLLIKLLDLGLYERVAASARAEARAATLSADNLNDQIGRIGDVSDAAVVAAAARIDAADVAIAALDQLGVDLAAADAALAGLAAEVRAIEQSQQALGAVHVPADLEQIGARSMAAGRAVEDAVAAESVAAAHVHAAQGQRGELPAESDVRSDLAHHDAVDDLAGKVARGTELVTELEAQSAGIAAASADASGNLDAAAERLTEARLSQATAAVVRHLHVGDACPVCGNAVDALPVIDDGALAVAETAHQVAMQAERAASAAQTAHDTKLAEYRDRLASRVAARDDAAAALVGRPARDHLDALLVDIIALDRELVRLRQIDHDARATTVAAREVARVIDGDMASLHSRFAAMRDGVAAQQPPTPSNDLVTDWKALAAWAQERHTEYALAIAANAAARREIDGQRSGCVAAMAAAASAIDVVAPEPAALRDGCVTAAANARSDHARLLAARAEVDQLNESRDRAIEHRQVHDLLAEQLGARGFEAWLLDEALDVLLAGASVWLEQLSSQRFAMAVDDKHQFVVIDHANADERRLARTLSGGETFLASLALALALAEHVSELSASGGRSLDAIFLDEGFGTLDPETLDVVATAIEELGATGRMVGVISHVRELAERVPVRFEITKGPGSSSVRRVDA